MSHGIFPQRVLLRELSVETPQPLTIFQESWMPEGKLQLNIQVDSMEQDVYLVGLHVTVTASTQETAKVLYLIEMKYEGVFNMSEVPVEQLQPALHILCPAMLFQKVAYLVTTLVTESGFPPVYLPPFNFEALYAERLRQQEAAESETIQ
jgi:preprotein translocase subunit SecB